jgi:hypothetical protein
MRIEYEGSSTYVDPAGFSGTVTFARFSVLKKSETKNRHIELSYYDGRNDTDYVANLYEKEKGAFEGSWSYKDESDSVRGDVKCTVTSANSKLTCRGTWTEEGDTSFTWEVKKKKNKDKESGKKRIKKTKVKNKKPKKNMKKPKSRT